MVQKFVSSLSIHVCGLN